jgi:hypothetical protein
MPKRSIYRATALQRRAQRAERPLPPPPVASDRAVSLMWMLLVLALAGLAAIGMKVGDTLESAALEAR